MFDLEGYLIIKNVLSPEEVRHYERRPHYVVQPPVEAGDVLIFTDQLNRVRVQRNSIFCMGH